MTSTEPLWTPTFVVLMFANLCCSLIFYITAPIIAGYTITEFDASTAAGGTAAAAFFFGGVVARLLSGVMDRLLGTRLSVLLSQSLYFITTLAYLNMTSVNMVVAVRFCNGVAFGFTATALAGAAMLRVPLARLGEGTGWFTGCTAISTGLGPLLALSMANSPIGYRGVFWTAAAVGLAGLVALVFIARNLPTKKQLAHANAHSEMSYRGVSKFLEPKVFSIGLVVTLGAVGFSGVLAYLDSFSHGTHLQGAAAIYFLVYAGVLLLSRPVAGVMQDRHGNSVVLIPALLSLVAGVVCTALAPSGVVLLVGACLLGAGYGTALSSGQAMALTKSTRGRAAIVVASYYLLVDFGTGTAPVVLGLMQPALGYQGIFLVGAAIALCGLGLYIVFARRKRADQADPA